MFGRKKKAEPQPEPEPTEVQEVKARPAGMKVPEPPKQPTIPEFAQGELEHVYGAGPEDDLTFCIYSELRLIREYMAMLVDKSQKQ